MRVAIIGLAMAAFALPAMAKELGKGLVVHLKTASGQDAGTAAFKEEGGNSVRITLKLKNLPAGDHGVHIHEKPLCEAPDFKTAGGHYNPTGKEHGAQNPNGPHAGDLPENITISANGTGMAVYTVTSFSLRTGAKNNLLDTGASIMVHAGADDMKTDPSGNSGARIACGVIMAPAAPGAPTKN